MPYIILDRDGVINADSADYIKTPAEWVPLPGSLEAIAELNRAGFHVLVATNQSGIARGFYDIATLDTIHEKMQQALSHVGGYIDAIFFCPHHPDDHCACRKPQPGLFYAMQEKFSFVFSDTYFIGDKWTDVEAALAVGLRPILVGDEAVKAGINNIVSFQPILASDDVLKFTDLKEAVDFILQRQ